MSHVTWRGSFECRSSFPGMRSQHIFCSVFSAPFFLPVYPEIGTEICNQPQMLQNFSSSPVLTYKIQLQSAATNYITAASIKIQLLSGLFNSKLLIKKKISSFYHGTQDLTNLGTTCTLTVEEAQCQQAWSKEGRVFFYQPHTTSTDPDKHLWFSPRAQHHKQEPGGCRDPWTQCQPGKEKVNLKPIPNREHSW